MECPVCKVTLQIAERQGIEIDYCPTCRGVWLDRGELDKIIERSAAFSSELSTRQAAEERTASHHEHRQARQRLPEKRKKHGLTSFLEDIFD